MKGRGSIAAWLGLGLGLVGTAMYLVPGAGPLAPSDDEVGLVSVPSDKPREAYRSSDRDAANASTPSTPLAPRAMPGGRWSVGDPAAATVDLDDRSAHVRIGTVEAEFELVGVGRPGQLHVAHAATALAREGRVEAARGATVTEWWKPETGGVEHGLTLQARPAGDGPVIAEWNVDSTKRPLVSPRRVLLLDADGNLGGAYDGLAVLDAGGNTLPSSFEATDSGVRIRFDDTNATYPVVVDPYFHILYGVIDSASFATGIEAGTSIDVRHLQAPMVGTWFVVGIPNAFPTVSPTGQCGVVQVYTLPGAVPMFAYELRAPACNDGDRFGASVAISETGKIVVGAPGYDVPQADGGAAFLFQGSTYLKPLPIPRAVSDAFGTAVAISDDGVVIAATAPGKDDTANLVSNAGAAHVFFDDGVNFAAPVTLMLSGADENDLDGFGTSIALAGDGTRVAVGDEMNMLGGAVPGDPVYGTAYVFTVAVGSGSLEATLTPSAPSLGDQFGHAVALDRTGATVVVGAPASIGNTFTGLRDGAAFVYRRSGTAWTETLRARASLPEAGAAFGNSVSLDGAGTFFAVGAPYAGGLVGRAFGFRELTGTWSEVESFSGESIDARFGHAVAVSSDRRFLAVGAPGADSYASQDSGRAYAYEQGANGSGCDDASQCDSGICTEGVCCNATCGTEGGDCMSCLGIYTGAGNGTCAPVAIAQAIPIVTCRPAAGPCDVAETCATGGVCAPDVFVSSSTTCRPSLGVCDPAETCTGTAAACPTDVLSTSVCRPSAGACDVAESCDGIDPACPAQVVLPTNTVCRASVGTCDVQEVCDGLSAACPGDTVLSSGAICRASVGTCDVAELCNGASGVCPPDVVIASGTLCRAAASMCDVDDRCDGNSGTCPDVLKPDGTGCDDAHACSEADACLSGTCVGVVSSATTVCRASGGGCDVVERCDGSTLDCPVDLVLAAQTECRAVAGTCDVPEACDGVSKACPADSISPATTTCRPSAGACDVAERCDGTTVGCPADGFADATVECRAAIDGCDAAERCTGAAVACPIDDKQPDGTVCDDGLVCTATSACSAGACAPALMFDCSDGDACTTDACSEPSGCSHTAVPACMPDAGSLPDAGTDAGSLPDSGGVDAGGVPPVVEGGCSCRVATATSFASELSGRVLAFGLVAVLVMRRRRLRGPRDPARAR